MMVSVVIINKNDLGIVNTINGLNNQDYKGKFEIVVVDRSTIKMPKISSKIPLTWIDFDAKGKRFTIPEQRNLGIKKAKGDVVVFIDASCEPTKCWLTEILNPIESNDEMMVMGKTGSLKHPTVHDLLYIKLIDGQYVDEAPTINLAINKKVFSVVGLFDETLNGGEDLDFTWRTRSAGIQIKYCQSAYVEHDWGDNGSEIKRHFKYGMDIAGLMIKYRKTRLKKLLTDNPPAIIYPLLILFFPVAVIFPLYFLIIPLLVIKNFDDPNPVAIVFQHFIYGWGVLIEIKRQIFDHYVKNI